jgi:SAM-dependent methyltransferase
MMSVLPEDLSDFVFVDVGSGKGRALFIASDYNFKGIVGIEFSRELHSIAEQNVSAHTNKRQRCFNIHLILGDACNLDVPEDNCVFFFYNPFLGAEDAMAHVLSRIEDSFTGKPRKMYFLCLNPRHPNLFNDLPFVRPIKSRRFALRKAIIYESID